MFRSAFLLTVSLAGVFAAEPKIVLWPNGAPGSEGNTAASKMETANKEHDYIRVTGVHQPSLTAMLPPLDKATGAAMIIAPGGGHRFLSWDIEGTNVGRYLNSIGVAAFILKYRLAREPGSKYQVEVDALADARRSVRLLRARAPEFGVNPGRIGLMGFSAGGELAALASTRYDTGDPKADDTVERQSSRPDFQALIYPGGNAAGWTLAKDNPPAFLLCADDDKSPAENIALLHAGMKRAGIPAEVHVFASGGHGFGIRDNPTRPTLASTTWFLRLGDWMKARGYLEKK